MTHIGGRVIGKKDTHTPLVAGARYGMLTIVKRLDRYIYKSPAYLCQCDCGNTKMARAVNLRNGSLKSCGCMQGKQIRDAVAEKPERPKRVLPTVHYKPSDMRAGR